MPVLSFKVGRAPLLLPLLLLLSLCVVSTTASAADTSPTAAHCTNADGASDANCISNSTLTMEGLTGLTATSGVDAVTVEINTTMAPYLTSTVATATCAEAVVSSTGTLTCRLTLSKDFPIGEYPVTLTATAAATAATTTYDAGFLVLGEIYNLLSDASVSAESRLTSRWREGSAADASTAAVRDAQLVTGISSDWPTTGDAFTIYGLFNRSATYDVIFYNTQSGFASIANDKAAENFLPELTGLAVSDYGLSGVITTRVGNMGMMGFFVRERSTGVILQGSGLLFLIAVNPADIVITSVAGDCATNATLCVANTASAVANTMTFTGTNFNFRSAGYVTFRVGDEANTNNINNNINITATSVSADGTSLTAAVTFSTADGLLSAGEYPVYARNQICALGMKSPYVLVGAIRYGSFYNTAVKIPGFVPTGTGAGYSLPVIAAADAVLGGPESYAVLAQSARFFRSGETLTLTGYFNDLYTYTVTLYNLQAATTVSNPGTPTCEGAAVGGGNTTLSCVLRADPGVMGMFRLLVEDDVHHAMLPGTAQLPSITVTPPEPVVTAATVTCTATDGNAVNYSTDRCVRARVVLSGDNFNTHPMNTLLAADFGTLNYLTIGTDPNDADLAQRVAYFDNASLAVSAASLEADLVVPSDASSTPFTAPLYLTTQLCAMGMKATPVLLGTVSITQTSTPVIELITYTASSVRYLHNNSLVYVDAVAPQWTTLPTGPTNVTLFGNFTQFSSATTTTPTVSFRFSDALTSAACTVVEVTAGSLTCTYTPTNAVTSPTATQVEGVCNVLPMVTLRDSESLAEGSLVVVSAAAVSRDSTHAVCTPIVSSEVGRVAGACAVGGAPCDARDPNITLAGRFHPRFDFNTDSGQYMVNALTSSAAELSLQLRGRSWSPIVAVGGGVGPVIVGDALRNPLKVLATSEDLGFVITVGPEEVRGWTSNTAFGGNFTERARRMGGYVAAVFFCVFFILLLVILLLVLLCACCGCCPRCCDGRKQRSMMREQQELYDMANMGTGAAAPTAGGERFTRNSPDENHVAPMKGKAGQAAADEFNDIEINYFDSNNNNNNNRNNVM